MWSQVVSEAVNSLAAPDVEALQDPDAELVAAARVDHRNFVAIYERYRQPILRFSYARLGRHQAAETVTADVFLEALANLDRFTGDSFAAWLYTIARHLVADYPRRQRLLERTRN